MKVMKIKDLPEDFQIVGLTLIVPKEILKTNFELSPNMIIKSGWNKGFWCIKKEDDGRIYPVFFKDFDEVKEWKVGLNEMQTLQLEGVKND